MKPFDQGAITDTLKKVLERASDGRANLTRFDEDTRIIEDVGLSSLGILDLRCELEQLWELKISDEELARLRTVGELLQIIKRRR